MGRIEHIGGGARALSADVLGLPMLETADTGLVLVNLVGDGGCGEGILSASSSESELSSR